VGGKDGIRIHFNKVGVTAPVDSPIELLGEMRLNYELGEEEESMFDISEDGHIEVDGGKVEFQLYHANRIDMFTRLNSL
jgi:hypothetical protein